VEVVINDIGVVDGIVDVADGGCVGFVSGDMAGDRDGWGVKTVQQGVIRDELGGFVDIPTFFRARGSSLCAVCITASAVEVGVV
jgi:hypothetical protein